jgi:hypothetical protein
MKYCTPSPPQPTSVTVVDVTVTEVELAQLLVEMLGALGAELSVDIEVVRSGEERAPVSVTFP